MGQPWGLSGPEFIGLYVVGFLVSLLLVYVVQAKLSGRGSRAAGSDVRLDAYQAAHVAGGPARVVDTAIAGLALNDQLLVARGGKLTAVSGAGATGPVEAAVYGVLNPTASRSAVLRRLRHHPAITAIGDQVRARGLLLDRSRVLPWRLVLLLPVAVWCVGLARDINGVRLHRATNNLTALLVMSAAVTVVVLLARFRTRHRPSAAGRQAVRQLRQEYEAQHVGSTAVTGTVAAPQVLGVALLGFTALTDPALRAALVTSSGSSGGDSGSSGSCGGGGCGGGGGGGCGG